MEGLLTDQHFVHSGTHNMLLRRRPNGGHGEPHQAARNGLGYPHRVEPFSGAQPSETDGLTGSVDIFLLSLPDSL